MGKLISPVDHPVNAVVRLPGSKSYTNRALVCAALATGTSRVSGALVSDDTNAMIQALQSLGTRIELDGTDVVVEGGGGTFPVSEAVINCRLSGTTARFMAPLLTLGHGSFVLDGGASLRLRPMADQFSALQSLNASITPLGEPGCLPVQIDADGMAGGWVAIPGDVSSQFLSGLLLAAPCMAKGLKAGLTTSLVSRSYVEMTLDTMAAFGANKTHSDDRLYSVPTGGYSATDYVVEPDASAASYAFAAAAITGGRVQVDGLGSRSRQGDMAFLSVLQQMGCTVDITTDRTTLQGPKELAGVNADMSDCSDTAQTLAVVAAFANGPTQIGGIGFIRAKETDRIQSTVDELVRCGVDAWVDPDGIGIRPGRAFKPAAIETYHDHRMAMSFALIGLRVPGIEILDPLCVGKTFPGYWDMLDVLAT